MTQDEINKLWLVNYDSSVGKCTILTPPKREVPGLRKPYQFELPEASIDQLKKDLRDTLAPYKNMLQCDLVDFKRIGFGSRVNIFLLGFRPGFCGPTCEWEGLSSDQWNRVTSYVKGLLESALSTEVPVYIEPWKEKEKSQARYETYIKRK